MISLIQKTGDGKTHSIKLAWERRPFFPGDGFNLIFTLKSDPDTQTDAQAKVQKQSGYGISVTGQIASVSLIPIDTAGGTVGEGEEAVVVPALTPGTYYWDIQAQSLTNEDDIRSVAGGTLVLLRDVTRGTTPSIPIYVYYPPSGGNAIYYEGEVLNYNGDPITYS